MRQRMRGWWCLWLCSVCVFGSGARGSGEDGGRWLVVTPRQCGFNNTRQPRMPLGALNPPRSR